MHLHQVVNVSQSRDPEWRFIGDQLEDVRIHNYCAAGHSILHRVRRPHLAMHRACLLGSMHAARPEVGGAVHFLQCHLAVIGVLDAAKALGFAVDVVDEGDYWEQRDPDALAHQVGGRPPLMPRSASSSALPGTPAGVRDPRGAE